MSELRERIEALAAEWEQRMANDTAYSQAFDDGMQHAAACLRWALRDNDSKGQK